MVRKEAKVQKMWKKEGKVHFNSQMMVGNTAESPFFSFLPSVPCFPCNMQATVLFDWMCVCLYGCEYLGREKEKKKKRKDSSTLVLCF